MSSYRKVLIQGDNSFSVWKDNMLNLFQGFLRALFYTWTNISYTTKTLKNVNTDFLQKHLRYFFLRYIIIYVTSIAHYLNQPLLNTCIFYFQDMKFRSYSFLYKNCQIFAWEQVEKSYYSCLFYILIN